MASVKMLSSMALKPLAPVFLAVAFLAITLSAFSVKCNLTWKLCKRLYDHQKGATLSLNTQKRERERISMHKQVTHIVHAEQSRILLTQSIFWFCEDLMNIG